MTVAVCYLPLDDATELLFQAEKFSDLVKHRRGEHKKKRESEKEFECPMTNCSMVIKTKAALRTHIERIHFDE